MSDTELLKRIAEREGGYYRNGSAGPANVLPIEWNPLTNWSDCGPLIERYGVDVQRVSSSPTPNDWEWEANAAGCGWVAHKDLRRAICLAVAAMDKTGE